jgi:hypothetical protein
VYDNAAATQTEVDNALAALTSAMNNLVPAMSVNKTALSNKLTEANAKKEADYTAASWAPFLGARNAAQSVLDSAASTQAEVDSALATLTNAMNGLVNVTSSFTVTVNNSYAAVSGAGNYAPGAQVRVDAGYRSGYTFNYWNTSGISGLTSTNREITFVMPGNNVILGAVWTSTGGSDSGSYSGGGGGHTGSTVGPNTPSAPTTPSTPATPTEPAAPTAPGQVTIPDSTTPLGEMPGSGAPVTIVDNDTPLTGKLPKTGDKASVYILSVFFIAAFALYATGSGGFIARKRRGAINKQVL